MTTRARLLSLWRGVWCGALVGVLCGAASALFLWSLERVTSLRESREWLVYLLPLAGLLVGALYERWGASVKAGNNLVIDSIHDGGPEIPLRMAPLVLLGTLVTHLFGGSAGREGTAVQMGASLADWSAHRLRVDGLSRRHWLVAGVAGGFGSVFGTPIAGTVFGLEFVVLGRLDYGALAPALVAALVGDFTTRSLGVGHTHYPLVPQVALSPSLFLLWILFALLVALVAVAFIELTHFLKKRGEAFAPRLSLRLFCGGLALVLAWRLVGTSEYLGLGVPVIVRAFSDPDLPVYAFALKLLFTSLTLGAGFLGGEVTPLFFVGAALGSVWARWVGIPLELGAGVGMAAVFAVASNTPLALSIMAVEVLGAGVLPHVVIVCVVAYLLSGHRSIYHAQRVHRGKGGAWLSTPTPLRELGAPKGNSGDTPPPG